VGKLYNEVARALVSTVLFVLLATTTKTSAAAIELVATPEQQAFFGDLVRHNTYAMGFDGRSVSGPGWDLIVARAGDAQFVALGEEHFNHEMPLFNIQLLRELQRRYSFKFLALEEDPLTMELSNSKPLRGSYDANVAYARSYPNAFTFDSFDEIRMIADAESSCDAKLACVWGLDQAFGALHYLETFVDSAPTPQARQITEAMISSAKPYETSRYQPGRRFMLDVPWPTDYYRLEDLYASSADPESAFWINQLVLSRRIYELYGAGVEGKVPGALANGEIREENMKMLFMRDYNAALAAGEQRPRVVLAFGHYHMFKGEGPTGVLTLGNFVDEFARSNGMTSLHVALFKAYPGTPPPTASYLEPFQPYFSSTGWTVIDLVPIRSWAAAHRIGTLSPDLHRLIYGFDIAVFVRDWHQAKEVSSDLAPH
jgi:hypothetical protein